MDIDKAFEELYEGWKKGTYTITDVKTGKVLGKFKSGAKAQKAADDIFQKGDYDAIAVEVDEGVKLDEVESKYGKEIAAFKKKGGKVKKLKPGAKFKSLFKQKGPKKAPRSEEIEEARRMPGNVKDYIKFVKGQGPNPEAVFDVKSASKWVSEIKKGVKAGWLSIASDALGGEYNVSIMIKLTLEKEEDLEKALEVTVNFESLVIILYKFLSITVFMDFLSYFSMFFVF